MPNYNLQRRGVSGKVKSILYGAAGALGFLIIVNLFRGSRRPYRSAATGAAGKQQPQVNLGTNTSPVFPGYGAFGVKNLLTRKN